MKSFTLIALFTLCSAAPSPPLLPTDHDADVPVNVKNVHEVISYSTSNPIYPPPVNATKTPKAAEVLTSTNRTIGGFKYYGCQTDNRAARVLNEKSVFKPNMTYDTCAKFCKGSQFFGIEYSSECYCSSTISNSSLVVKDTDCSMPCSGDAKFTCGGMDRISVFKATDYVPPIPIASPAVISGYAYRGCYADTVGARTLNGAYHFDEKMTSTKCSQLCKGSTYFGTEYGGECYCSALLPSKAVQLDNSKCDINCKGNKDELCGGGNKLSVYWKMP